MTNRTLGRRNFIGLAGAGIACAGAPGWLRAASAAGGYADLILLNAHVYTVDGRQPTAEALAVRDRRFLAVGSNADMRALAGKGTQQIDAAQMTVVPGFNDS